MSGRIWAITAFASIFALLHCGGSVEITDGGGGFSGVGGGALAGHAGSTSSNAGGPSIPLDAALDEYADPGCPEAGPPVEVTECDPFAATPACDAGQGCFPFVDHPNGDGCGAQSFGTECLKAGTGRQGATCGDGPGRCASGFVCVVGSQPGEHCVQLCRMGVQNQCPAGLICGELDVEGYGVCS
jgi:hypothetical protein